MSYYKDQQIAFKDLDKLLIALKKQQEDVTITFITYELTKEHPVSPKVIKQRIINWAEINDVLVINDFLKFSKVKN